MFSMSNVGPCQTSWQGTNAPRRHLPNIRVVNSSRRREPIPCRGQIRGLTAPARQIGRNYCAEQYCVCLLFGS